MSHIRYIDQALRYIYDKIFRYFSNSKYIEGTYKDNCLVELCCQCYEDCIIEPYDDDLVSCSGDFDTQVFSARIYDVINDEIGVKVYKYFEDRNGILYEPNDKEFGEKQKQYIDWAFSAGDESCEWCSKYVDVTGPWRKA